MDKNTEFVIDKRVERTVKSLNKHNINAYYVKDSKQALIKIKDLIRPNDTISVGGSMTLMEIGAIDMLREGEYNFLDRYAEGLSGDDIKKIYRDSFYADVYLTSSNAITENGELYNVDGRGNRVSAMIYGPDKVVVVVGINKIVKNMEDAVRRNEEMAAPANTMRLNKKTPCAKTGYCSDCSSEDRICNAFVTIKRQGNPNRMHVIIVNESLGY